MSFSKDSKQKLIAISAAIIVFLLGVNAFLLYNKYNQDKVISQQTQEIDEAEKLRADLEKQYYESLSELEEMRGNNEELNTMIDQQKLELKEQKDKISRMIRQGKSNKAELAAAREQMSQMRTQLDEYLTEINTLKEEKQLLTDQNMRLNEEKNSLMGEVEKERTMNEELTTAKAALVSERENLMEEKDVLSRKVNIASVVKVSNINATGEKVRKSGKPVRKKNAKAVDRLKICFTATQNAVTDAGVERFYVRIINPLGETLAVEDLGSGVMTNTATNEEIRFTQAKDLDYNNDDMVACFLWEPNTAFSKGEYEVEVYNKGFLAGKGNFRLK
ncbi:MAG: hypothetical protein AAGG75_26945 [Bacteroidota bacterium]